MAWTIAGLIALAIIAVAAASIVWYTNSRQVYIDVASVSAPEVDLAPASPGILEGVYVNEGDQVPANATVARVGDELIQTKSAGVIISVPDIVGAHVAAGEAVVKMIDPSQLRIVGKVDENKGLDRIRIGDTVSFTVDAFGSRAFSGVVDEIAPTSEESAVVFNISDKREVKQFDVKVRFDTSAYPELKNGMSARMWVYVQ